MAKGGSNKGRDDAVGGNGMKNVGCEDEVDDDGDDNDNNSGVEINDADCGEGNSSDDGGVDGNGVFGKWCVDGKGDDEADGDDEQTESVVGDLVECNGSSKMETRVGVMQ